MPLKIVPLNPSWCDSSSKEDLHAIYRRPSLDAQGQPILDAAGRQQWDTTSGLPLRRHSQWTAKGFQYVTLSDRESLAKAAPWLRSLSLDPQAFAAQTRHGSPWNFELYRDGIEEQSAQEDLSLLAYVKEFGPEAYVMAQRLQNPDYELPPAIVRALEAEKAPTKVEATPESALPAKRGPGRPRKTESA